MPVAHEQVTVPAGVDEFVLSRRAIGNSLAYVMRDGDLDRKIHVCVYDRNGESMARIKAASTDREILVVYDIATSEGSKRVTHRDDPSMPRTLCEYCGAISDHYGVCDHCGAPLKEFA